LFNIKKFKKNKRKKNNNNIARKLKKQGMFYRKRVLEMVYRRKKNGFGFIRKKKTCSSECFG
jgi:hypothetical protein